MKKNKLIIILLLQLFLIIYQSPTKSEEEIDFSKIKVDPMAVGLIRTAFESKRTVKDPLKFSTDFYKIFTASVVNVVNTIREVGSKNSLSKETKENKADNIITKYFMSADTLIEVSSLSTKTKEAKTIDKYFKRLINESFDCENVTYVFDKDSILWESIEVTNPPNIESGKTKIQVSMSLKQGVQKRNCKTRDDKGLINGAFKKYDDLTIKTFNVVYIFENNQKNPKIEKIGVKSTLKISEKEFKKIYKANLENTQIFKP